MSIELMQKLEEKIDNAVETIELFRLQIEELEERNQKSREENQALKTKYASWEENLSLMLEKLESIDNKQVETPAVTVSTTEIESA